MPIYEFEGNRPAIGKSTYVHPEAVIIGNVEVGEGCFIEAGVVIRGDFGRVVIGRGTNIQDLSVIHADHDSVALIGNNVLIGHKAIVHGPCIVNDWAAIGMGAIVSKNTEIGAQSMLAAGSLLAPGVTLPPRKLAMGNPAKKVKDLSEDMMAKIKLGVLEYQEMGARCSKGLKLIVDL